MLDDRIPFDELMIGATLNLLAQTINRRVVEALHAQGYRDFRPAFHPVFQWLAPEGSRISDLARATGVTRSAMSQLVDILAALDYVERAPDPRDGRAVLIRRTARGHAVNRIAREVVVAAQAEWSGALGPDEFARTLQALRQLTRLAYAPASASRASAATD